MKNSTEINYKRFLKCIFVLYFQSYVNCELGIDAIGTVMICFGVVTSLSSFGVSYASRHLKRFPIIISGALFHTGLFVALLWWQPKHDDPAMFYVISGCLGMCDAIWQTQTNSESAMPYFSMPNC